MFCVILRQEPANIRVQLGFMEKNAICVGTHCMFPGRYALDGKAYSGNLGSDVEVADKRAHLLLIRAGSSSLEPN